MAEGFGKNYIMSLQKAAVWGTLIDTDIANRGFRAKTFTWQDNVEELPDEGYNGATFRRQSARVGRIWCSGSFTVDMKYNGFHRNIAGLFGSAAVAGASPYRHNLTWNDSLAGVFYSMGFFDGVDYHTVDSLKIHGLTFTAVAGHLIECEVRWTGRHHQIAQISDFNTLTEPSAIDYVQFLNSTQDYQRDTQGGTLADIELRKWQVVIDRSIGMGDEAFTTTDAPYPREIRTGEATCTGTLEPPYESNAIGTTAVQAGTIYELKLNTVLTAVTKEFAIFLPSVKFTSSTQNPAGRGQIPQVLTFTSEYASTAPSWSAPIGLTQPSVQFYNADATAALS